MRLHASREIEASPSSVFAAFEDEARLARWWGPDGFTSTFQSFALEPGRMWTFVMHGPDGKDYKNQISVLEVVPSSKIVLHHVSGPRYLLTVTLESTSGGTTVGWNQEFENPDVGRRLAPILTSANEEVLTRLGAEVTGI
ncbi:Activator of Hsp90 ATPase homolog 1-like protein [Mycobacteroides abscessus subsp. bolletii]|uniref:SRPBCC family protein n=1 Tax=Mycobacteroides abscessus TaxID=36809 RepID=UPI0009A86E54|nr:SRPBCC family protein [Mycobacteroides abscessus]SLI52196.1 Activator of Hsp90 ATPase homolog 1-like protein [Mycobacteroides abscessus subsp. bolletii]